jgi:hypothetical protein
LQLKQAEAPTTLVHVPDSHFVHVKEEVAAATEEKEPVKQLLQTVTTVAPIVLA